jgi:hypothetical protein
MLFWERKKLLRVFPSQKCRESREEGKMNQVNPSHFSWGVSVQSVNEWYRTIAEKHKESGYPTFATYDEDPLDPFSAEQRQFVAFYWSMMRDMSQAKLDDRRRAKYRGASKQTLETFNSGIFVIEDPKGSGLFRSYRTSGPGVSVGKALANGKSGGLKYEETYRAKLGKLSVRNRGLVIQAIQEELGCDNIEALRVFNVGRQPRGFLKHYGNGLWSGTDPSVSNPTEEEINRASKATKVKAKTTESQDKWQALLGELPKSWHNHDRPERDEVLKWILADENRKEIVGWFQSRCKSPKVKELSLEEYAHYLWDDRRNMCSRYEDLWPTFKLSSGREQGKRWYDVCVWRTIEEKSQSEFVDFCIAAGYSRTYLPQTVQQAIRQGDLVKIDDNTIVGAETLRKREEENQKREKMMARQRREFEERRKIKEEKARIEKEENDRIRNKRRTAERQEDSEVMDRIRKETEARINKNKRAMEVADQQPEIELQPLRGQEKEIGKFLRNLGFQRADDLDGIRERYGIGWNAANRLAKFGFKTGNMKRVADEDAGRLVGYHGADTPEPCEIGS